MYIRAQNAPELFSLDATTGSSICWIEHANRHMPILLDPDGPFSKLTDRNVGWAPNSSEVR